LGEDWRIGVSGYGLELDSGSGWQSVYHGEDTEYQVKYVQSADNGIVGIKSSGRPPNIIVR
jgi:hypothetical protein